jgi:hypothetical protein
MIAIGNNTQELRESLHSVQLLIVSHGRSTLQMRWAGREAISFLEIGSQAGPALEFQRKFRISVVLQECCRRDLDECCVDG